MDRIIKFKAWDKKGKKMFTDDDMTIERMKYFDKSFDGDFSLVQINELIKAAQKECILLQFTGLLDKNGKEIYENDILLIDDGDCESKSVVTFEKGSFWVEVKDRDYDITPISIAIEEWDNNGYGFIVIGNVYENKDLLNEN